MSYCFVSVDDDPYEAPSSIEAEANSSDGGFDDLDITDQQDLSNTAENSNGEDQQVRPCLVNPSTSRFCFKKFIEGLLYVCLFFVR